MHHNTPTKTCSVQPDKSPLECNHSGLPTKNACSATPQTPSRARKVARWPQCAGERLVPVYLNPPLSAFWGEGGLNSFKEEKAKRGWRDKNTILEKKTKRIKRNRRHNPTSRQSYPQPHRAFLLLLVSAAHRKTRLSQYEKTSPCSCPVLPLCLVQHRSSFLPEKTTSEAPAPVCHRTCQQYRLSPDVFFYFHSSVAPSQFRHSSPGGPVLPEKNTRESAIGCPRTTTAAAELHLQSTAAQQRPLSASLAPPKQRYVARTAWPER